jgi:polar amino acid transport system substrate-binding protein
MTVVRRPAAPAILLAALLAWSAPTPGHADTITLRADEWCPYNCAPASERPGYAVEVVREVFAQAGHRIDYGLLSWTRSIEDARDGRYDGIIGAIPADAPDFVFPRESIGASGEGYAVRRGTAFRFEGPESFTGKMLGAVSGYAFAGPIGAYVEAHKDDRSRIQLTSGDDALAQNLRKLVAGRLDIVVDDANVLAHAVAAGLGERVVIADRGAPAEIYVAFSPACPKADAYAAVLSEGTARLRASGRLAEILAHYDMKDWR